MGLVKARKFTYAFSLVLILASLASLFVYGLKLGIDFTGGSVVEVEYGSPRPGEEVLHEKMSELGLGQFVLQPAGESGFSLRTRELGEADGQRILGVFSSFGEIKHFSVASVDPPIGRELRTRSVWAALLVLAAIILYIAFAFRKVSKPVSSWFYGLAAVIALFHDIFIPLGVFSALGHFKGVEIDTLFVTAILTVLGFSVHDTIVVFDRIRENLKLNPGRNFEEIVGKSLSQTIVRSINTSLTVLVVLSALYFFGAESTKYFAFALIVGIIAGTYSSIFIASPLLVTWNNWRNK
ncbi:MAG: protein translocase subunit SecF [bacterium]|nr:protein translocase subunit SecF [bacterium]